MGAVVVSTSPAVIATSSTCRVNPIDKLAKLKITFNTTDGSRAAKLIDQGELDQLGDEIMSVYNKVSQNCYETHQRMMINNSFVYEYKNGNTGFMDTYWDPYVVCNNSCPSEDPLFGVDTPDIIARLLQDLTLQVVLSHMHQLPPLWSQLIAMNLQSKSMQSAWSHTATFLLIPQVGCHLPKTHLAQARQQQLLNLPYLQQRYPVSHSKQLLL